MHDFFRRLYYVPIILAAFKFRLRGALVVSALTVSLYAPHLLVYFGEINMELLNQFLEAVMFIVLGFITGYLVEEDYQARRGHQLGNDGKRSYYPGAESNDFNQTKAAKLLGISRHTLLCRMEKYHLRNKT